MEVDSSFILDLLSKNRQLYLKLSNHNEIERFGKDEGRVDFFSIYKVEEITFEDRAPRKEALENVISSMNIERVNFIYIILGDRNGVEFYYGAARDYSEENKAGIEISEIGEQILKPSLQGNFRGSKIRSLSADQKKLF